MKVLVDYYTLKQVINHFVNGYCSKCPFMAYCPVLRNSPDPHDIDCEECQKYIEKEFDVQL